MSAARTRRRKSQSPTIRWHSTTFRRRCTSVVNRSTVASSCPDSQTRVKNVMHAEGFGVQDRCVSFDDTGSLHVPDTLEARGLRKPDLLGDLVAGLLAVFLEYAKNLPVDVVEGVLHGHARFDWCFTRSLQYIMALGTQNMRRHISIWKKHLGLGAMLFLHKLMRSASASPLMW